jgi:hypothetical protein
MSSSRTGGARHNSRLSTQPQLDGADTEAYAVRRRPTMPQLIGQVGHVVHREMQIISDALRRNDVELVGYPF